MRGTQLLSFINSLPSFPPSFHHQSSTKSMSSPTKKIWYPSQSSWRVSYNCSSGKDILLGWFKEEKDADQKCEEMKTPGAPSTQAATANATNVQTNVTQTNVTQRQQQQKQQQQQRVADCLQGHGLAAFQTHEVGGWPQSTRLGSRSPTTPLVKSTGSDCAAL